MRIISNYEGSSINLLSYNDENNSAFLSLKEENDGYSQYYNFIADNKTINVGKIFIKNIDFSKYYNESFVYLPYERRASNWERISSNMLTVRNDTLEIIVPPNEITEVSLVPRYTQNELNQFVETIFGYNFINIKQDVLTKIEIGSTTLPTVFVIGRQHPGETLSSFFIEGMIKSIIENGLHEKYHYVFYPIVNTLGVKNGCHRYVNGIDFNRSWALENPPQEITYLKNELDLYNIKYFIDVHDDEITPNNYIRTNGKFSKEQFSNFDILKFINPLNRWVKEFVYQGDFIDLHEKTANDYALKKYKCTSILVELSIRKDYTDCKNTGYQFALEL